MTELLVVMKTCRKCGTSKTIDEFSTYNNGAGPKRRHSCKDCRNHVARGYAASSTKSPERLKRMRELSMFRNYGLTVDQYQQMFEARQGLCDICGRSESRVVQGKLRPLCVDHDHESGQVRGLLCSNCNVGIGMLSTPELLNRAVSYLSRM